MYGIRKGDKQLCRKEVRQNSSLHLQYFIKLLLGQINTVLSGEHPSINIQTTVIIIILMLIVLGKSLFNLELFAPTVKVPSLIFCPLQSRLSLPSELTLKIMRSYKLRYVGEFSLTFGFFYNYCLLHFYKEDEQEAALMSHPSFMKV